MRHIKYQKVINDIYDLVIIVQTLPIEVNSKTISTRQKTVNLLRTK